MARTMKSSDYYHWYKDNRICVYCGKEMAIEGGIACLVCKMDKREKSKTYYRSLSIEDKRKHNLSSAAKKQWCRDNGICYHCYKRPVADGKKMCGICLAKNRERAKLYRQSHGSTPRELLNENGICYFCGKTATKGYRTCPECRERCIKNLPATKDNSNHIWRKHIRADVQRTEYNKTINK